jgi:DNA-binding beta-propeller fold protein YncE
VNRREFLAAAAVAPFALRTALAAAGDRAPVAVVTCDTEARVAAVDATAGRVLRSIAVLPGPRSVESVGAHLAVVAHTAYGAVTILDGASLATRHVLREFEEPRYTAAHPDGRHAFVTDSGSADVVAVDAVAGKIVGRVHLVEWPRHVSLDPAGRTLWVGLGNASDRVAVVDVTQPARPRLVRYVRPPFGAHDVGWLPDGRAVWVTSGDRGAMAVFDARTFEPLRRLAAGAPPQHVTFGAGVAYVTSGDDGTLHVHSLRDGRAVRATTVPTGSYNVQHGYARVLTPSLAHGTLTVLDGAGRLLREVRVAPSSHDACFVVGPPSQNPYLGRSGR